MKTSSNWINLVFLTLATQGLYLELKKTPQMWFHFFE